MSYSGKSTLLVVCVFLLSSAVGSAEAEQADRRPDNWAQPVEIGGVPNLHRVSDGLYRSAQPTEEGMRNLKKLGVVTIVNLRSFHSDRDEIGDTDLKYEHITMKAWHPEEKEVVRFLKIVSDPKKGPVLLHCQHGADRTGLQCAVYRVAIQGWSKREALREMTEGGYGFHRIWVNLPTWFEDLPIEKLARQAGIDRRREQAR